MANRVTMERGGQVGFWVSKPGFDVLTTAEDNMMISTSGGEVLQVVASGIVNAPSGVALNTTISIPNQGFIPLIFTYGPERTPWIVSIGNTSFRMRGTGGFTYYWVVTNMPLGG